MILFIVRMKDGVNPLLFQLILSFFFIKNSLNLLLLIRFSQLNITYMLSVLDCASYNQIYKNMKSEKE